MISIIVPVYHVEKELRRCLDSILCQTFTDLELILVNDGGNEAETSICEEYAEKDSRIVYRYQSRYEYIKEHHPEMLDTEKNVLAFSALKYAEVLSQTPNGRHKMNKLKNMLKNENIMLKGASLKREMAFKLWYYFPGVFTAVIKSV